NQEHTEPMVQIIIGKTSVIIDPLACIAVETDDRLISAVSLEICTMELQSVMGGDPHILVGLLHHPVMPFMHDREIASPVHAGHLHRPFCLRVIPHHRPSVEICGPAGFRRLEHAQKRRCSFQLSAHFSSPAFLECPICFSSLLSSCCSSGPSALMPCRYFLPPSVSGAALRGSGLSCLPRSCTVS